MPSDRRRDALRALLPADLDALLVTDLVNIRYLTGFTGSNAALLVHADGDAGAVFCTDGRYTTQSAAEVPDLGADRPAVRGRRWPRGAGSWASTRLGFESVA